MSCLLYEQKTEEKKITQKNRWVPRCYDLNITCPLLVVFGKVMEPLGDGVSRQEAVSREGGWVTHSPRLLDSSESSHQGLMPPAFPSALLLTNRKGTGKHRFGAFTHASRFKKTGLWCNLVE